MGENNGHAEKIGARFSTVRVRTWTLTLAIVVALVLYLLVNVVLAEHINVLDLLAISAISIATHAIYFPDGSIYGEKDQTYINNRAAYNERATAINKEKKVTELREYIEYEYQIRKQDYINTELGKVGVDSNEFAVLKTKSPNELRKLSSIEIDGKLLHFTLTARHRLIRLIYGKLPIEKNSVDTIMSALDHANTSRIRNKSKAYSLWAHIRKCASAILIGLYFAYVSYSVKDGVGFGEIARAFICFASMFATAVMSFSEGETCVKVYKNQFYVELTNYIDGFNEWLTKHKNCKLDVMHETAKDGE